MHDLDVHPDGERIATGGCGAPSGSGRGGGRSRWPNGRRTATAVPGPRPFARRPPVASAGDGAPAKLWDIETAAPLATFEAAGTLDVLSWSLDGKWLIGGGSDGRFYVDARSAPACRKGDIDNRREIEDEPLNGGSAIPAGLPRPGDQPRRQAPRRGRPQIAERRRDGRRQGSRQAGRARLGVAFHPAGRLLAYSYEKELLIWDFEAAKVAHRLNPDQLGQFGICFFDEGRQLRQRQQHRAA